MQQAVGYNTFTEDCGYKIGLLSAVDAKINNDRGIYHGKETHIMKVVTPSSLTNGRSASSPTGSGYNFENKKPEM